jgi:hypothetical protein
MPEISKSLAKNWKNCVQKLMKKGRIRNYLSCERRLSRLRCFVIRIDANVGPIFCKLFRFQSLLLEASISWEDKLQQDHIIWMKINEAFERRQARVCAARF